jgi:Ca2+-binding EF-hand superfamily protein
MPVEPDNGIGDGADPIPTMPPEMSNTYPLAEIQSLLQGLDMAEIGSLLQMISPDELAQMLQQESGMDVSAADIAQLLQQLGLSTAMDTNIAMPANTMPAETHNDMVSDTQDAAPVVTDNSSASSDVQSLLQTIDPDDINLLLETISPEQLAEMLQQESGLTVSAEDIAQLLQQIQQDSNDTSVPSNPIPVEPDNGIGDGAPDLGDLLTEVQTPAPVTAPQEPVEVITEPAPAPAPITQESAEVAAATVEIQDLLQQLDTSQFSSFFDLFSADQLAEMLTQEGTNVTAEEVQALLSQIGLSA